MYILVAKMDEGVRTMFLTSQDYGDRTNQQSLLEVDIAENEPDRSLEGFCLLDLDGLEQEEHIQAILAAAASATM